jgi:hypothetical protein
MQVELVHWNDLTVATAGSSTFDTKGRALARLAHIGENCLAKVGTQSLRKADGRRRLALAEGSRRDSNLRDM